MEIPVVVMGVSGVGKTTLGLALAGELGRPFIDADDLHPAGNLRKMRAGVPLDDDDRLPWLRSVGAEILRLRDAGPAPIVACSALKERYRDTLRESVGEIAFLHLAGDPETVTARVRGRTHAYMPASLLNSQFASLEPPLGETRVLTLDICDTIPELTDTAASWIRAIEKNWGGEPARTDGLHAAGGEGTGGGDSMQIGMVGLGRMGANIARRAMRAGHGCVAYDPDTMSVEALSVEGAMPAASIADLVAKLEAPRVVWLMIPAGLTGGVVDELGNILERGDVLIDGGNSNYRDDVRRGRELRERGIHYVDVGTSGGVYGLERGYCLMVGGPEEAVAAIDPLLRSLAPGLGEAPRTLGRGGEPAPEELGYLHCGTTGAGHFVKMVHNGIEYGMMAAFAEGLNLLAHADAGARQTEAGSAEVAPLEEPELYTFDIDTAKVAELWRRGSVVSSWLLDLTAAALHKNPSLDGLAGRVSDSGEGRWTVKAAVDVGVPVPVLAASLFQRFASQGEDRFANQVLSAMRQQFGGHHELPEPVE